MIVVCKNSRPSLFPARVARELNETEMLERQNENNLRHTVQVNVVFRLLDKQTKERCYSF